MDKKIIVYGIDFFENLFNIEYTTSYDWDKFVNSSDFRILIKRENIFYSNIDKNIQKNILEYQDLVSYCDALFLWNNELHSYQYNNENENNYLSLILKNPKIFVVTGGVIHNEFFKKQTATNLSWLKQTVDIYKDLKFKLDTLTPYIKKPFLFDALLGLKRYHRDFVYEKIKQSKNCNKFILSYNNNIMDDSWLKDADVNYFTNDNQNKIISSKPIVYYNKNVWIAHVIPFEVYNKSTYSIITETNFKNGISFPTEKTAKPILGKRLFVVFSGQHFLRSLKEFGFKTFNEIIDESYDDIEDHTLRWEKAWKAIEYLVNLPQEEVLEKIRPIIEHNYNHLMNFPFDDFVKKQCTEILVNRYYESQRVYS